MNNENPETERATRQEATTVETVEETVARRRKRIAVKRSACALLLKLFAIAAVCFLLFGFVFGIAPVSGEGMYPRMRDGDLTVFYRPASGWNIGDIAVYMANGKRYYGRVVARGGDKVDMTDDGQLVVNGSVQQEEVFFPTSKKNRKTQFPVVVKKGELFVLGDYRISATDSRDFGPIAMNNVRGKVILLIRWRGL